MILMSNITELSEPEFKHLLENSEGSALVDFWAPWCGPCKSMLNTLDEAAEGLLDDQKIYKVNIDEVSRGLLIEMGVRSVPTLIAFKDGVKTHSEAGMKSKEEILQMLS